MNQIQRIAYSPEEAGKAIGLSRSQIYVLIKQGRIKPTKVGRRTVIPAESLHALIAVEL